ncbi:unnamed protein product [Brugia timori]|uniref:Uncharacterized protein n=1 Tax=Brugia timori TaxID=42155 RepID=A0A0R3QTN5_9BILA|nr:unnamed protein product [Brugia timori]
MKTEWKVKNFEFHSSLGNSLAYIEPLCTISVYNVILW